MVLVESEFCGSSVFRTSSVELETTFPLIVVAHVEGSSEHIAFLSSYSTVLVSTVMYRKVRVHHCLPTERKILTGAMLWRGLGTGCAIGVWHHI